MGRLMQQRGRCHDHAVGAVAALRSLFGDEGCLDPAGLLRRPEPFERRDRVACDLLHRCHAGAHRLAVKQHRTGAALGQTAAEFGRVQAKRISQDVEERLTGVPGIHRYRAPVDSKLIFGHKQPPSDEDSSDGGQALTEIST